MRNIDEYPIMVKEVFDCLERFKDRATQMSGIGGTDGMIMSHVDEFIRSNIITFMNSLETSERHRAAPLVGDEHEKSDTATS